MAIRPVRPRSIATVTILMSERFLTRDWRKPAPAANANPNGFCGVPIGGYTAGGTYPTRVPTNIFPTGVYSPTNGVPIRSVRNWQIYFPSPTRALATWSSLATSSPSPRKRNGEQVRHRIDQSISNKDNFFARYSYGNDALSCLRPSTTCSTAAVSGRLRQQHSARPGRQRDSHFS